MSQSVGSVALYNIVIVFLVIVFAFLAATISYSKAFRVNSRIIFAIEKYEGYNQLSADQIEDVLETLGYTQDKNFTCPTRTENGQKYDPITRIYNNYAYCIYLFQEDARHYTYGVQTYLYVDLPFVQDVFKLPIYTKTERIFYFHSDDDKIEP